MINNVKYIDIDLALDIYMPNIVHLTIRIGSSKFSSYAYFIPCVEIALHALE